MENISETLSLIEPKMYINNYWMTPYNVILNTRQNKNLFKKLLLSVIYKLLDGKI